MRYALIILAFFFCAIRTDAQVYQAMPQAGYGPVKRMLIDSVLTIPIGISALRNITGGRDTAQIRYQKSDSSVYVYTGSSWVKLGTGGGGGGGTADSTIFFTVYRADTMRANIYASIVSTDSSVYFTKYRSDTMRANLYSYIKNADSLTYFTKYRSDTMRANIYAAIPQPDTFYVKYPVRVDNDTIYLAQSFVDSVGTGGGGGGGAGTINFYLNGSISQGTFGGTTYYQLSQNPIFGAGTNFTRTNAQGNGYIASFITDANDPNVLGIPGGNWNLEFYFAANSSGGSPQFYAEVYKYDGSTFTLLASGSTNPETITNATTVDQYFTSIPVPTATLLATDRIAVRVYVIPGGRNITLHTENSNLSEVLTTLTIPAWKTNGNSDVNAGKFLGSTNNASVRFRTNNVERMVLDSTGNLTINQKTAGNDQSSNFINFSATGSTGNAQSGSIYYEGFGTSTQGSLKFANSNGNIDLRPSNGDVYMTANNPQLYTTNGGPRFTNNSTSAGFIFGNYNAQSSGNLFNVKNDYSNPGERNPFTIFANGNIKMGQIGVTNIDSGYTVDMTGNAVRISNTAGTSTPISTALLDLTSTNRGLLIPRMTTTQRNAISSPATGLMVWNTTDSIVNQYNGNRWQNVGITAMTQAAMDAMSNPALGTQIYNTTYDANCTFTQDFGWWSTDQNWLTSNGMMAMEDFLTYPIASTGNGFIFQNNLTGGAISAATPISNRPGILQLSTSTSATGRAAILSDGNAVSTLIVGGGKIIFESDVQIPTLSSSAQTFAFSTGFSGSGVTTANNAIYFLYDSAGATTGSAAIGRWQVVCSNASTRTYTTTDSTVTAGRWYRLRFEVNAAGTSVNFYINGALVKTETNNIPTGNLTPAATILKSNGTTARTALIDYIRIRQKFTTPR